MKMIMLRSMRISPDGFRTHYYEAEHEYEIPELLARSFYADNIAVPVISCHKPPSRSADLSQ